MTQLPTTHPTEEDLILYQLHESPTAAAERTVREHLELCPACAELAGSIAETLRVFSAEPVPTPDLDRAWHRLRAQLPALTPAKSRPSLLRPAVLAPLAGLAVAALLLLAVLLSRPHARPQPTRATLAPGPLTTHPVDPAVAAHLDSAERFLTEVSHTSEPLDPLTRRQAHTLLLENAVYVRSARDSGDLADAAVLEKLGRVLTAVDHDPEPTEGGWRLRFELNANGVLLDLRILRQNETQQHQGDLQ